MLNIKLYNMAFNPIVLNKQLSTPTDYSCVIKDAIDLMNPVIELEFDASILNKNYMYIPDFGRYYFIEPPKIVGKRIFIQGHVDVLKTYNSQIRSGNCTATRSNKKNNTIPDTMVMTLPSEKITYRKLSTGITGDTYVLIIGGK